MQLRELSPRRPAAPHSLAQLRALGEPVVKEFQDEYFTRYALVLDTFAESRPRGRSRPRCRWPPLSLRACTRSDALLDLVFVEDRAYRLTIGRGLGQADGPAARAGRGRALHVAIRAAGARAAARCSRSADACWCCSGSTRSGGSSWGACGGRVSPTGAGHRPDPQTIPNAVVHPSIRVDIAASLQE